MNNKLWTKQYIYSVLILLFCHLGPYLVISVISIFAKQLTGSDAYAGMMASVFAVSGLAARFISVVLLNRFSSKKVLILSESVMAAASFAYIFCQDYWMAFILRGIQGMSYGIAVTAMSTYIISIIPAECRLEGISYSSLTASLCNIIGPMTAFAVLGANYDHFQMLFILVFATTLIALFGFMSLKETHISLRTSESSSQPERLIVKTIILPILILFVTNLSNSAPTAFISLYAIEKGLGSIGLYFTFNVIGLLISRVLLKPLNQYLGESRTILLIACMFTAALFGLVQVKNLIHLYMVGLPLGFSMGAMLPLINTILVNRLPKQMSGLANSLFYAAGDMGFIIGSLVWGVIAGMYHYTGMFLVVTLVSVVSIILAIVNLMKPVLNS